MRVQVDNQKVGTLNVTLEENEETLRGVRTSGRLETAAGCHFCEGVGGKGVRLFRKGKPEDYRPQIDKATDCDAIARCKVLELLVNMGKQPPCMRASS